MSFLSARPRTIGLILAGLVYWLDQWIKRQVDGPWGLTEEYMKIDLLPFFDLTRTHNHGVSMGFLTANSMEMRWGLVALTAGIALIVFVWLLREKKFGDILPLGMVLGGALGNIHDRYRFGYVLDYADFHIGTWHFYIFNLADAAITVGVAIILARSFLIREKTETEPAGAPATEN
ncbi:MULTISPECIES: signal peptidase II [unclassified Novosphingobium]|uniref:signal peptidase II n=1 Tax=unclassified Novosphingobium TaxID=2644732 RepID=UPI000EE7449F|nr:MULTISPECIES: signal peptidase II [unclassified Novosphingobium]HCF24251.1 signal peptidase II [Novosphingobium sp.]HQV02501.1 signal peptidase II [Novosphingobium sp.]